MSLENKIFYIIETVLTTSTLLFIFFSRFIIFKKGYRVSWFITYMWWVAFTTSFICAGVIQASRFN